MSQSSKISLTLISYSLKSLWIFLCKLSVRGGGGNVLGPLNLIGIITGAAVHKSSFNISLSQNYKQKCLAIDGGGGVWDKK